MRWSQGHVCSTYQKRDADSRCFVLRKRWSRLWGDLAMADRRLRAISKVPWRHSLKKRWWWILMGFFSYLFAAKRKELCRSWLMACSSQRDWERILWRSHQVHSLSLHIHLFFLCALHPVLLESINWNYNNAKWPSVFCFLRSFMYIKHMWLWLANSACDLLTPYKKEEEMMARLPQEDFTKAFWMSGHWGLESGFIGWILNLQDLLIELVH